MMCLSSRVWATASGSKFVLGVQTLKSRSLKFWLSHTNEYMYKLLWLSLKVVGSCGPFKQC